MAKAIYDVQVPNIGEVERALGDMRDKAPRAMKNAVNQTATRAKNMMIRQARLRYAVNSAGRRHLNALKVRNRATTQNPTAEIFISSRRNDLGDFQSNPSVPHMGRDWVLSPGVPHIACFEKIADGSIDRRTYGAGTGKQGLSCEV